MRLDLISRLSGVQVRPSVFRGVQRNIGIASHHDVDEAEATGGGVSTKTEIPDPFGLRVKYASNPDVIACLDKIYQAVQEFNLKDGKEPLNLRNADLRALGNLADENSYSVNLERYILGLGAKNQYPLDGAILSGASLDGASLDGANLDGASLDGAILDGASLDGASLDGANLNRAILNRASLIGAILNRAILDGANLNRAILNRASLDGASLNGAYVYENNKRLTGEDLKNYLLRNFPDDIKLQYARFE